jgi:hypothetical protein
MLHIYVSPDKRRRRYLLIGPETLAYWATLDDIEIADTSGTSAIRHLEFWQAWAASDGYTLVVPETAHGGGDA